MRVTADGIMLGMVCVSGAERVARFPALRGKDLVTEGICRFGPVVVVRVGSDLAASFGTCETHDDE